MKLLKISAACVPFVLLMGCAKQVSYSPKDFVNPNREVVKKVPVIPQKVDATFAMGNDPAVEKAYQQFAQNGVAQNIDSKGFKTFSYDPRQRPIVTKSF